MRRLLLLSLAILLVCGVVRATEIPQVVEPKNYPIVWTETIYNGSTSTITSGYIVEWTFETSNSTIDFYDDMCPWVKLCDGAGDIWTAGVVPYGKDIPATSEGQIIIHGPAHVFKGANTCTEDTIAESTTSGEATNHDGAAVDEGTLGVCAKDTVTTDGPDGGRLWTIIYVNPIQYDKDA